jgi:hypothetical protein
MVVAETPAGKSGAFIDPAERALSDDWMMAAIPNSHHFWRSDMRRTKSSVRKLLAPMAMTLLMGLAGCVGGYGYVDEGPEWNGVVFVGGGPDRGYGRDYHPQAFHNGGGRPAAVVSARGKASMGARAGGGGHARSGGDRK